VPASAVTPAPRAYPKIVAVKKPVVENRFLTMVITHGKLLSGILLCDKGTRVPKVWTYAASWGVVLCCVTLKIHDIMIFWGVLRLN